MGRVFPPCRQDCTPAGTGRVYYLGIQVWELGSGDFFRTDKISFGRVFMIRTRAQAGWSLCDDRIQNTQCKVVLKRFTATLSSNYVEHIESLRFELNCVDVPLFLMEPFSRTRPKRVTFPNLI